jgi:hypothetical protein
MPTVTRILPVRTLAVVVSAVALTAVLLSGCTTSSTAPLAGSRSASALPSAGSTPTGSTPNAAAPSLDATPLDIPCSTLVPASAVGIYSGMAAVSSPRAPSDTDAAAIAADRGTVCSWKDTAAGTTMTVAAGRYSADSITRLKDALVSSSTQVPTYTGEGYFTLSGTTGTAEAFTGPYWVVAISDTPAFGEPGGAEPVVDAALAALAAR